MHVYKHACVLLPLYNINHPNDSSYILFQARPIYIIYTDYDHN